MTTWDLHTERHAYLSTKRGKLRAYKRNEDYRPKRTVCPVKGWEVILHIGGWRTEMTYVYIPHKQD